MRRVRSSPCRCRGRTVRVLPRVSARLVHYDATGERIPMNSSALLVKVKSPSLCTGCGRSPCAQRKWCAPALGDEFGRRNVQLCPGCGCFPCVRKGGCTGSVVEDNQRMVDLLMKKSVDDPERGCRLWTGRVSSKGYGVVTVPSAGDVLAHRLSWELAHGQVRLGFVVCHKCDTPRCINANHLFLGTNEDNMQDKVNKGRHRRTAAEYAAPGHGEVISMLRIPSRLQQSTNGSRTKQRK